MVQPSGPQCIEPGAEVDIVLERDDGMIAGIGFTTEHDLHRYVRRVLVLEQVLGATPALTRELGSGILEERRLPALLPL